MKKLLALCALVSVLLPSLVLAADLRTGKELTLRKDDAVRGDLYVAGGSVSNESITTGDFSALGGTVLFLGGATQDVQVGGGTLTLTGAVGDDLRAAGGTITIGSAVGGDALVAGGQITLLPSSTVNGDLIVAGGTVSVSGVVAGGARIYGSDVILDGDITGPVLVQAEKLTIGSRAVLHGQITYRTPSEATILSGADIRGKVSYEPSAPRPSGENMKAFWAALIGVWVGLKMLMLLAGALLIGLYFRKTTEHVAQDTFARFGMNMLLGFVFLVATPIAGVLLCVTVIGGMIGALVLLGYAAMLLLCSLYLPVVVGAELLRYWRKESHASVSALGIVVGAVVLTLLAAIPFAGSLIGFALFLSVLGASLRLKWENLESFR